MIYTTSVSQSTDLYVVHREDRDCFHVSAADATRKKATTDD